MQRRTFLTTTSSCALGYLGLQNYLSAQGSDRVISPYGDLVEDPDGILDLPEGFTYHDDHVGPAKNPWWINENKHSASADADLVPPTGIEPAVTLTVPDQTRLAESQYSLFRRRHLDANAESRPATSTTLVPIS